MQSTVLRNDFNYYMHDGPAAFSFEVAGRISDNAARELEQAWRTASSTMDGRSLVVDLSYVTQVDEAGERLLRKWYTDGAELIAKQPRARQIVASITGQPCEGIAEAPRYHTWHPVHAFLAIALIALLFPAPVVAGLFRS